MNSEAERGLTTQLLNQSTELSNSDFQDLTSVDLKEKKAKKRKKKKKAKSKKKKKRKLKNLEYHGNGNKKIKSERNHISSPRRELSGSHSHHNEPSVVKNSIKAALSTKTLGVYTEEEDVINKNDALDPEQTLRISFTAKSHEHTNPKEKDSSMAYEGARKEKSKSNDLQMSNTKVKVSLEVVKKSAEAICLSDSKIAGDAKKFDSPNVESNSRSNKHICSSESSSFDKSKRSGAGRPKDKVRSYFIVLNDRSLTDSDASTKIPRFRCTFCNIVSSEYSTPKAMKIHLSNCSQALQNGIHYSVKPSKKDSRKEIKAKRQSVEDYPLVDIFECERGCGFEHEKREIVEEHEHKCVFVKRKRGRPRKSENVTPEDLKEQRQKTPKRGRLHRTIQTPSFSRESIKNENDIKHESEFKTITLYCKQDFLAVLQKNQAERVAQEKREKEVKLRRSINSMSEAEQLRLALEASLQTS